jgi:hypothetical protein
MESHEAIAVGEADSELLTVVLSGADNSDGKEFHIRLLNQFRIEDAAGNSEGVELSVGFEGCH